MSDELPKIKAQMEKLVLYGRLPTKSRDAALQESVLKLMESSPIFKKFTEITEHLELGRLLHGLRCILRNGGCFQAWLDDIYPYHIIDDELGKRKRENVLSLLSNFEKLLSLMRPDNDDEQNKEAQQLLAKIFPGKLVDIAGLKLLSTPSGELCTSFVKSTIDALKEMDEEWVQCNTYVAGEWSTHATCSSLRLIPEEKGQMRTMKPCAVVSMLEDPLVEAPMQDISTTYYANCNKSHIRKEQIERLCGGVKEFLRRERVRRAETMVQSHPYPAPLSVAQMTAHRNHLAPSSRATLECLLTSAMLKGLGGTSDESVTDKYRRTMAECVAKTKDYNTNQETHEKDDITAANIGHDAIEMFVVQKNWLAKRRKINEFDDVRLTVELVQRGKTMASMSTFMKLKDNDS